MLVYPISLNKCPGAYLRLRLKEGGREGGAYRKEGAYSRSALINFSFQRSVTLNRLSPFTKVKLILMVFRVLKQAYRSLFKQ